MPLTKDFKDIVRERAEKDPEFLNGLLIEAINAIIDGDFEVARIILPEYIHVLEDKMKISPIIKMSEEATLKAAKIMLATKWSEGRAINLKKTDNSSGEISKVSHPVWDWSKYTYEITQV
jgi:hypothetical protein